MDDVQTVEISPGSEDSRILPLSDQLKKLYEQIEPQAEIVFAGVYGSQNLIENKVLAGEHDFGRYIRTDFGQMPGQPDGTHTIANEFVRAEDFRDFYFIFEAEDKSRIEVSRRQVRGADLFTFRHSNVNGEEEVLRVSTNAYNREKIQRQLNYMRGGMAVADYVQPILPAGNALSPLRIGVPDYFSYPPYIKGNIEELFSGTKKIFELLDKSKKVGYAIRTRIEVANEPGNFLSQLAELTYQIDENGDHPTLQGIKVVGTKASSEHQLSKEDSVYRLYSEESMLPSKNEITIENITKPVKELYPDVITQ